MWHYYYRGSWKMCLVLHLVYKVFFFTCNFDSFLSEVFQPSEVQPSVKLHNIWSRQPTSQKELFISPVCLTPVLCLLVFVLVLLFSNSCVCLCYQIKCVQGGHNCNSCAVKPWQKRRRDTESTKCLTTQAHTNLHTQTQEYDSVEDLCLTHRSCDLQHESGSPFLSQTSFGI